MAIKFLIDYGVRDFYLAGFDGYAHDLIENYADAQMAFITRKAVLDAINRGMELILERYSKSVNITFVTEPRFIKLHKEDL